MHFDLRSDPGHPIQARLVIPAVLGLIQLGIGLRYGCVVSAPPGFHCENGWALPVPSFVGWPINALITWMATSAAVFLVWIISRESLLNLVALALSRFAGRSVRANPYALLGTTDQGGFRPPGLAPLAGDKVAIEIDPQGFRQQAERAFRLVQRAWALQDAMAAREVVTTNSWHSLSMLIDDSRRRRRGGIAMLGLNLAGGRVLAAERVGAVEAARARLHVCCQDPLTDCEQDWTFVRDPRGHWLVAAVDPVEPAEPS